MHVINQLVSHCKSGRPENMKTTRGSFEPKIEKKFKVLSARWNFHNHRRHGWGVLLHPENHFKTVIYRFSEANSNKAKNVRTEIKQKIWKPKRSKKYKSLSWTRPCTTVRNSECQLLEGSNIRKYMVCIVWNIIKWRNGHIRWVMGGFSGYGGSVWVMGE